MPGHLVRKLDLTHRQLLGNCWQHEAVAPCAPIRYILFFLFFVFDTQCQMACATAMKRYSLSLEENLMENCLFKCSTQVERYAQILHLRKGHEKGNLAFIYNGKVCTHGRIIGEPDSALLTSEGLLAVCKVEGARNWQQFRLIIG